MTQRLEDLGVPTVLSGRPLSRSRKLWYVDADNVGGGRLATSYLIESGRLHVATVAGPQPLPGHGERALLAVLALSAGRPVALTTLIDSMWQPDALPDGPINALQVRVSKLRRALA